MLTAAWPASSMSLAVLSLASTIASAVKLPILSMRSPAVISATAPSALDPLPAKFRNASSRRRSTSFSPHSPDDTLIFGVELRDSDIAISSLSWIERGGDDALNG